MSKNQISIGEALLPILVLVPLLAFNVYVFGDNSLGGPNQFALLLAASVGVLIGINRKIPFDTMLEGVAKNISNTTGAILILLMIGSLAGTWLISGVIPTLIIYGLKILNPVIFLFASTLICAVVSIASGSSWSTIATVGIALLGIGKALGFDASITAGAIISGAYFGDKMSPLSDTTNLAAAMAETDLFDHIRYMTYTTIPSFGISSLLFLAIGFFYDTGGSEIQVDDLIYAVNQKFNTSPWLFLVPGVVVFLIIKKVKPLPVLLIGSLLGAIFALIFQQDLIRELAPDSLGFAESAYHVLMTALTSEISITTENVAIADLLSSSGMYGMLNTVWLIICAMTFGGILESVGALHRVTQLLLSGVKNFGSLVLRTAGSCAFVNLTASDQYLAIVIPGKMFKEAFDDQGVAPENLSRTLEDSGTVTSVLVPWNTCGAAQSSVLGVATLAYLPFCFFNILSPIMTIAFAYFNIKIKRSKQVDI